MKLWAWLTGGPIRRALTYMALGAFLWVVGQRLYNDQSNLDALVVDYLQRHPPVAPQAPAPAVPAPPAAGS